MRPRVRAQLAAILDLREMQRFHRSNPNLPDLWDEEELEDVGNDITEKAELCGIDLPLVRDPYRWLVSDEAMVEVSLLFRLAYPTGGLFEHAAEHWARGSDKYRAAELVANGPVDYQEFVSEMWPGETDRTRLSKLFHGLKQKINGEVPFAQLVRVNKNTVQELFLETTNR